MKWWKLCYWKCSCQQLRNQPGWPVIRWIVQCLKVSRGTKDTVFPSLPPTDQIFTFSTNSVFPYNLDINKLHRWLFNWSSLYFLHQQHLPIIQTSINCTVVCIIGQFFTSSTNSISVQFRHTKDTTRDFLPRISLAHSKYDVIESLCLNNAFRL